jgi:gliding motility-associated-like protein
VVPNLAASTSYTFYVVNAASCSSAVSAPAVISPTLSIPSIPSAILTQPTCPIPTGTLNVTSPLGATFVYAVNGGAYQAAPTFAGLTGGNYTLSVQNSVSGCITQNPSAYIINPTPVAPVISILYVDSVSCFGLSNGGAAVQIDSLGTPPFVFSWSPMGGTNDTVTGLPIGNYNIVVVDAANCVVVQGFSIFQPTALSIIGDSTPIDCASGILGTMDVSVTGGTGTYTYLWTPNGQTTDSISNLNIGNYGVNVSDANGCQIGYAAQIVITNSLNVAIQPNDTTINPGGSFAANVNVGNTFLWTPNQGLSCNTCPNPLITPDTTTLYFVDVVDANGCQGQDSMLVTVKLLCGDFFVPSIFSPNGTGPDENNILKVLGKEVCVKDFSFMIFDRWGEKIFEGTDISQSWDGFYKGKPMQMGNFVYDLNIQMYDDTMIHKSGSLTLVR